MQPNDTLKSQLISVEYCFDGSDRIQLERKEDLRDRGLESPDLADALALTFAEKLYMTPKGVPNRRMQARGGFDPLYMLKHRIRS